MSGSGGVNGGVYTSPAWAGALPDQLAHGLNDGQLDDSLPATRCCSTSERETRGQAIVGFDRVPT